jgi:hypothetical protein
MIADTADVTTHEFNTAYRITFGFFHYNLPERARTEAEARFTDHMIAMARIFLLAESADVDARRLPELYRTYRAMLGTASTLYRAVCHSL